MTEDDVRRELVQCGRELADMGLIQGTWGNLSARLDQDFFLITPSGADYYGILPEDIVKVDMRDGTYEAGKHPSSERLMHQLIYLNRPDLGGIVHTHSPYCSVFAACRKDLVTSRLDYPCASYAVSGSRKLVPSACSCCPSTNLARINTTCSERNMPSLILRLFIRKI